MKTPEIRIFYAWLYRESVSEPLREQFGWKQELESDETLETYAENYRNAWEPHSERILTALCEALDVEFYKQVIDVACMPAVSPASDPVIISFRTYPDQFIDVLTHELCHVLLTDNTIYSIKSSPKEIGLLQRWQKLFGSEHEFNALVHIPVHALCKYIYLDVLKEPARFDRDVKDVETHPPYAAAWDYVNSHDYTEIIAQLKADYTDIKAELKK